MILQNENFRDAGSLAAPNASNGGAKRVEWRCQTSNTRDAVTVALKVEEVVEEENCNLARIGHLFGTANDGAVLADIAVRLYFADNGAIVGHVAIAFDAAYYTAALADGGVTSLNLHADGEEQQEDSQFAKRIFRRYHRPKEN